MSDERTRPSAWMAGLLLGLFLASVEISLIAVFYGHLDFADQALFLTFYAAARAGAFGAATGLLGTLAARAAGFAGLCAGTAAGAFAVFLAHLHLILDVAQIPWASRPALAGVLAAALGAALVGAAVAVLPLPRWLTGRGGWIGVLACAVAGFAALVFASARDGRPGAIPAAASTGISAGMSHADTNLLLITIDTLRADHMEAYGYGRATAPRLSSLAEGGVLFERAVTQRTSTAPALATLLTGMYPPTHRVLNNGDALQDFNLTMAEILSTRGYFSRAVISNPGLTARFNFHQGFERYQADTELSDILKEDLLESRNLNELVLPALVQAAENERPFFLWVHYRDPHTPYLVPEDYRDLYTNDSLARAHDGRIIPISDKAPFGAMSPNEAVYGSQDLDFLVAQYDAEIRFNDDSIGLLFDEMDRLDLWKETLVVVTSDHGESLWEHEYFFDHGDLTYETTAHVPLIFHHPELPAGQRIPQPVSLVDFLPTVLDLLDIPLPPTIQGASFAPLLYGRPVTDWRPHHFIIGSYRYGYQTHAVTTSTHKLVLDVDQRWLPLDALVEHAARVWTGDAAFNPYRSRRMLHELYDLRTDIGEEMNLAGSMPDVEEPLGGALWEWIEATYRAGGGRGVLIPEIDEKTREALEALGYTHIGTQ